MRMTDPAERVRARAVSVLGDPDTAEEWLDRPALGLGQRRPADLLGTAEGVREVETLLARIEHGVHA
jgi:putative toxin-antitoxin system antitoxin component (TIGR02293 family)